MFCFCFFRSFCAYFSLQTLVFGDGGRKNVSCPMAQGTQATPLLAQCTPFGKTEILVLSAANSKIKISGFMTL